MFCPYSNFGLVDLFGAESFDSVALERALARALADPVELPPQQPPSSDTVATTGATEAKMAMDTPSKDVHVKDVVDVRVEETEIEV
jgi:hypothetical protein